jgi:NAD kinase
MHTRDWKAALAVSAMCTALLIATAPAGADNHADAAADDFTIVSVDGGDGFVSAAVSDDTLTVEFAGSRTAGTGFYSGAVTVTCGGATYDLPFLAVVNR